MITLEFEMIGKLVPVTVKTDEIGYKRFMNSLTSSDYMTFVDENIIINMKNVLTVHIRK